MAETSIEWTTTTAQDGTVHGGYSFNAWVGCQKISVGPQGACENCYAELWAKRTGQPELWLGQRRRTTESYWRQPLKWNALAAKLGVRLKVFCCSLADVFDNEVNPEWRYDLVRLIRNTPELDWLLLTKRIGNARQMLNNALCNLGYGAEEWDLAPLPNVWLGATIANQEEADRDIPKLLATPAQVRFLSCEPLLGAINARKYLGTIRYETQLSQGAVAGVDWVIAGGESGAKARPSDPEWFRSLKSQCAKAGVAFFMKQMGGARDKRGNLEDLPEDLRVREFAC